jgi:limonene-1,2-epoxide hydrolase
VQTEQEKANVELVDRFCADWAKKDARLLTEYLADDIVYQMFEGQPDIVGKEAFVKALDGFLKSMVEVDWEMVRSYAIGDMVMNERVDHFVAETEDRSMHFDIIGIFRIRDGKISVWRDFGLPGGKAIVGSSVGKPK